MAIPASVVAAVIAAFVGTSAQTPRFELTQKDLFAAGGSFVNAWADYDADGDLDLFVGLDGMPNRLYQNTNGRFADAAAAAGLAESARDARRSLGRCRRRRRPRLARRPHARARRRFGGTSRAIVGIEVLPQRQGHVHGRDRRRRTQHADRRGAPAGVGRFRRRRRPGPVRRIPRQAECDVPQRQGTLRGRRRGGWTRRFAPHRRRGMVRPRRGRRPRRHHRKHGRRCERSLQP